MQRKPKWALWAAALTVALAPMAALAQDKAAPGEMTGNVKVGDEAPDFTLKGQDGDEHTLSELVKQGPVALVYFRSADW